MCGSTKQCIFINFCFQIGKTATELYQLLQQAYGENAMGRKQVFEWFHQFKEGRTSVESDPRSGRPSTSRNEEMIAKVRKIIRNNRRLTVREIPDDCGISVGFLNKPRIQYKQSGGGLKAVVTPTVNV